jgi:hypothetical protein
MTDLPPAAGCVRPPLRIKLRRRRTIRRAQVWVNGKLLATRKGRSLRKPVVVRHPPSTFRVRVRIKLKNGRVKTGSRDYSVC